MHSTSKMALVTGGAGFIGGHTVDLLLGDGWKVVVVDDLSSGAVGNVASEADLEVVDISDRKNLDRVVERAKPSAVFHLGAQSSVMRSVADPARDCDVNVRGTLNVVDAASRHGAAVVFTSTGGALYGDRAPIPTPEDTPPAPISPYGASKWAGEAYIGTWREATGLGHSVCRLANVYGPRQSAHGEAGVVAIFSHQLWSGQEPNLYGFGKPTRDFVHVQDVARALLAALGAAATFNVSTGVETDVLGVFNTLQNAAGTALQPQLVPLRQGELQRSCMDPSRANQQLHWRAEIDLADGLATTYQSLVEQFEAELAPEST